MIGNSNKKFFKDKKNQYQSVQVTRDSSDGRAIDCRSIGHWFDSGSREDLIRGIHLLIISHRVTFALLAQLVRAHDC